MVGRKREIRDLEERYAGNEAQLIAIYGRRRVGKTYLVNELFKDRITFRHASLSPIEHEGDGLLKKQLDQFYYSLVSQGMEEAKKPKSWLEAFFLLEKYLQDRDDGSRQLVFLDEMPWMDTPRSGFLTAFEGFWNNWGCHRKNLMVIVCGSASSWILDNLINNHGGLYNRLTFEIKLEPFTLKECEDFFRERDINMSRYDIVQSYMAIGGIPYYLGYFRRNLSLAQNIDELFFKKNAVLRDEYNRLFESIFARPDLMKRIVRTLSSRNMGYTRGELLKKLDMKDGKLFTNSMNALVESDFVIRYVPFGGRKNDVHYRLVDPLCIFWLHFKEKKAVSEENFWQQNLDNQAVVSWRGIAFENVCWCHLPQIKNALGISGVSTAFSAWTKKPDDERGFQIDMLIIRRDDVINMCEIKYYSDDFKVDQKYYRTLLRRQTALLEEAPAKASVHSTLITTYGLVRNEYSGAFTDVVTMDDLFA